MLSHLTNSGSIHEKQDPVLSAYSLLTLISAATLQGISQLTQTSNKRCFRKQVACNLSPVSLLLKSNMLSYPSLSTTTLFLLTSAALLAVYFIRVPGGSLRVKCQRPGCSQTHNEYEMIQRDCGKERRVCVQAVLALPSPSGTRVSQAGQGWTT